MALQLNQELQNKNKYSHLEISILKYSDAMKDNDSKRIDSEFFKKEYLGNNSFHTVMIKNIAFVSDGDHSKFPENQLAEVRYYQAKDIKDNFIQQDTEHAVFVSKDYFDKNERSHIFEENVLISIMGNVGDIAITPKGFKPAMCNRAIAILKDIRGINPYYLFSYLLTNNATIQIERNTNGGVQQRINLEVLKQIKIPLFPLSFQQQIEQMVKESHLCLEQSKALYCEAEVLLYRELGLDPENPLASIETLSGSLNISVRTLKESFLATGRLDSEYYQQKYDEIERIIKNYRGGYFQLSLSELRDKNFTPQAQTKYRYIELANIGANGNISEPIVDFGENLPSRARRIVKTGDMIMSSVEGSLQSCALITDEFNDCIVSTGFYVLKSSNLNSETLLVLFKSKLFQDYLHKFSSGTILTAISKDELQNIVIPKIAIELQTQIAEKIKQSFTLRQKANELLQTAKQSVENAIEKG